jgi:putative phage-type endonuclease
MDYANLAQGTEDWLNARLGKVTASRVADLMATTKTGYGASRANYMAELLCERLTGQPAERFSNAAMQWGTATEPQARAAYSFMHDVDVIECGLILHPTIAEFGASPDGLVGADGLVEIKCPNTATHIDTLLSETVPDKYVTQMQVQMACTGRAWCDFVSFDPRCPAELQMWVKRVPRDPEAIAKIEAEVTKFLGELDAKIDALRARFMQEAA